MANPEHLAILKQGVEQEGGASIRSYIRARSHAYAERR